MNRMKRIETVELNSEYQRNARNGISINIKYLSLYSPQLNRTEKTMTEFFVEKQTNKQTERNGGSHSLQSLERIYVGSWLARRSPDKSR